MQKQINLKVTACPMTDPHSRPAPPALPVNGILLLNKPAGLTSNRALQIVKRLLGARKAGHTGSLDPAATGMLPLCFGEATKVCAYLLESDKSYRVTAQLGSATDTADADGTEIATADVPQLSVERWEQIFAEFTGEIDQIPPMYSALKHQGKRLYELARKGETVERPPRKIRIHSIALLEATPTRLAFRVNCSKGTYVRTLVEDMAKAAGTLAYTLSLHREAVAGFDATQMLDLSTVKRLAAEEPEALLAGLLPPDQALQGWARVDLGLTDAAYFVGGRAVAVAGAVQSGQARVYAPGEQFLGVGELAGDGLLAPRRIFNMGTKP